jgi:hypothetical protein
MWLCALSVAALGATAPGARAQILPADVHVQVGYADGLRSGPGRDFFPSVWEGDPGVIFYGAPAGTVYDAGAIRIVNDSASALTLLPGAVVDGFTNGASFQLWDGQIGAAGTVIAPGQSLILTQNDPGGGENFDTSDQPIQPPTSTNHGDNTEPVVHLAFSEVLGGASQSFVDQTQTLNTLGYDIATYGYTLPNGNVITNESFDWRDFNSQVVGPGVPEPGSLAMLVGVTVSGGVFAFRRRRAR